jgi:hypothetical protein
MNAYDIGRYTGQCKNASWRSSLLMLPKFRKILGSLLNSKTLKDTLGRGAMTPGVKQQAISRGNRLFNLPMGPVSKMLPSGHVMKFMDQIAANNLTSSLVDAPTATVKDKLKAALHNLVLG